MPKNDVQLLCQPLQINKTPQFNVEKAFKEHANNGEKEAKNIVSKSEPESMNMHVRKL